MQENGESRMSCDIAFQSDFPCAGFVRTYWFSERDVDICEEHRRRMLEEIRDEWAREQDERQAKDQEYEVAP